MTNPIKSDRLGWIRMVMSKRHGGDAPPRPSVSDDLRQINRFVAPMVLGALAAAVWVGWRADAVGPVLLWVFASVSAGGAAGFLFGIPRSGLAGKSEAAAPAPAAAAPAAPSGDAPLARARPNTNLEEVSDWLTKIIVGLTLVNLDDLRDEVGRICLNAAAAMRPNPTASDISAATALVVGFTLLGFLAVYLYMRLFVQGAIIRSDDSLVRYRQAVDLAERIVDKEPPPPLHQGAGSAIPEPVVPSAASLNAAQAVADAAPANAHMVLQPLRQLATEYEALRGRMEYSAERTQSMTTIVHRMRPHAIAAAPYIGELMESTSTGEHLAATVILQMKYMPEHMEWLARRLTEERAFIGYQAASALLARVRVAGPPECKALQDAVRKAKLARQSSGIAEASLDQLIEQILAVQ
ncbi:MAG: hypothetical protein R3E92_24260 [Burkholderiaceae bacterium]